MSRRILVIEDTENNRHILSDLLTNAGVEVLEAVDGEKGIAMAAEVRPDLILMDIQLPIVDGYEATRRIKANPDLRHIPIIAVTSYALSCDDAKALEAGVETRRLFRKAVQPARHSRQSARIPGVRPKGAVACALRREYWWPMTISQIWKCCACGSTRTDTRS